MDSQRPEGQRFAGLCVNQEDFSVQDHAVASGERLRDVLLEMGHLKHRPKLPSAMFGIKMMSRQQNI